MLNDSHYHQLDIPTVLLSPHEAEWLRNPDKDSFSIVRVYKDRDYPDAPPFGDRGSTLILASLNEYNILELWFTKILSVETSMFSFLGKESQDRYRDKFIKETGEEKNWELWIVQVTRDLS
jgi:hypothetical protein